MSCIYGPHQFGTEDQGWVAHFIIRALEGTPINIYGDGRQVRDILFVEDLIDGFLLGQGQMAKLSGEVFNIGGGPANTLSLLELTNLISKLRNQPTPISFADWRPADQRYYVSDIRKFGAATGWKPRVGVEQGVERLYQWLQESRAVLANGIIRMSDLPVNGRTRINGAASPGNSRHQSAGARPKVKRLFPPRISRKISVGKLAKAV